MQSPSTATRVAHVQQHRPSAAKKKKKSSIIAVCFKRACGVDGVGPHAMSLHCAILFNPFRKLEVDTVFSVFYGWKDEGFIVSGDLPKVAYLSSGR